MIATKEILCDLAYIQGICEDLRKDAVGEDILVEKIEALCASAKEIELYVRSRLEQ